MVVWTGDPTESQRRVSKQFCHWVAHERLHSRVSNNFSTSGRATGWVVECGFAGIFIFLNCAPNAKDAIHAPDIQWMNGVGLCGICVYVCVYPLRIMPICVRNGNGEQGGGLNKRVLRLRLILNRAWLGCSKWQRPNKCVQQKRLRRSTQEQNAGLKKEGLTGDEKCVACYINACKVAWPSEWWIYSTAH